MGAFKSLPGRVSIWEYPALMVGVIAILSAIAKFLLIGYRWARDLEMSLDYIRHEMQLNSGKTMRDAIERIEQHLGIDKPE